MRTKGKPLPPKLKRHIGKYKKIIAQQSRNPRIENTGETSMKVGKWKKQLANCWRLGMDSLSVKMLRRTQS